MDHDTVVKRAQLIGRSVEVRNMFCWAAPPEILKALRIHCTAFYGCMLWDLGGEKACQVYSAWDTAVKLTWGCPRYTRTFLLQQVLACGDTYVKADILSRYGKFSKELRLSISKEVRVFFNLVARNLQTNTAKDIKIVEAMSGTNLWAVGQYKLKKELHMNQLVDIPIRDRWRLNYLALLLRQHQEARLQVQEDRVTRIQELINSSVQ